MDQATEDLRYPVGRYRPPATIEERDRLGWIANLDELPTFLRRAVHGLNEEQLATPYRPAGWTVRQVVHHLADSHINSYVRFRLALTEADPLIKPYAEPLWAELPDAAGAPIELSLGLLEGLHGRWVALLRSLSDAEFRRTFQHPENGTKALDWTLGLYAWHSRHHVAQIVALRTRNGW